MWYDKIKENARKFTVFLAYNANIDAIIRVKEIERNFDYQDYLEAKGREVFSIDTKEDVLAGILQSMESGSGMELETNGDVAEWIKRNLVVEEKRMGGQIGIMSNMLARLGFNCLVYFPLLSKEQASLFVKRPNLKFLTPEGWKESGFYFKDAVTKINWIFEFEKGDKLFDTVAKDSSRFIVAQRPDEDRIKSPLLEAHIKEINEKANVAILSGYHDVKRNYSDSNYIEQIKSGEKILNNLSILTQLEFGSMEDIKIREAVIKNIASNVDIVSMDSRELISTLEILGEDIGEKGDVIWDYKALKIILERLNLKCVKMHRKNYFISLSRGYLDKKNIEKAFEIAREFSYLRSDEKEIAWDNLKLVEGVRVSEEGIKEKQKLENYLSKKRDKINVVVVPNKINSIPKITVGLGDVISGGSFAIENLLSWMR